MAPAAGWCWPQWTHLRWRILHHAPNHVKLDSWILQWVHYVHSHYINPIKHLQDVVWRCSNILSNRYIVFSCFHVAGWGKNKSKCASSDALRCYTSNHWYILRVGFPNNTSKYNPLQLEQMLNNEELKALEKEGNVNHGHKIQTAHLSRPEK